jgi:hypothetical protein
MLPDFPALKSEIQEIVNAALRHRVDTGDPVLSQIKRFTQHEGVEMRFEQRGGGTVQSGAENVGASFEVRMEEVPGLVGDKLSAKLEKVAQDMISKLAKLFFERVGESCRNAGTSFDTKGKPLSPELLLDMFDTVETEFGLDGNPTNCFVLHPSAVPALKKVADQIENDPELKRRNEEILRRQRDAWAARESNRKLVD